MKKRGREWEPAGDTIRPIPVPGSRLPIPYPSDDAMQFILPVVNFSEAKFECTFGRGCEGFCCRESRPPLEPAEIERIDANLDKFLPLLRPEARAVVRRQGYLSGYRVMGQPTVRLAKRWCVFFNRGCVLHQVGEAEGDRQRYKPIVCALFPLDVDDENRWYVRQKGFNGEDWDLPCLDPAVTTTPATESLREEHALAERLSECDV